MNHPTALHTANMETSLVCLDHGLNCSAGKQGQLPGACYSRGGRNIQLDAACSPRTYKVLGAVENQSSLRTWLTSWLSRSVFQTSLIEANKRADECLRTCCRILYLGGLLLKPCRKQDSPGIALAAAALLRLGMDCTAYCCRRLGTMMSNPHRFFRWLARLCLYAACRLCFWSRSSCRHFLFFVAVSERNFAFRSGDNLTSLCGSRTTLVQAP